MFKKFKSHLDETPKPLSNEATFFSPVPRINAICDNPFQKIARLVSKVTNGNGGGGAPNRTRPPGGIQGGGLSSDESHSN